MNRSWQQLLSASSLLCWHFLCHFFFSFFLAYFFTLELFKLPRLWGASENMPYFHLYHLLLCIVTLSVHALDLRLQIKERVHFSMTATQNIWQEKEIWRRASYYSGLLKKLFWEMDWSLFFLNAESWFGTIVCVCVSDLLSHFDVTHRCVACVYLCIPGLSFGLLEHSIFVPHMSHQYFTPSSWSLCLFSRPVLSFTGVRLWFYLCFTTHRWGTGWDPVWMIWVGSGAVKKLFLPDGCKQSFGYLFQTFINPRTVDRVPHHVHMIYSYSQRT